MLVCVDCCLGLLLVFAFYCYLLECVVWLFGLFVGYVGYLFGGLLCFGLRLWLIVVFVCFDCVAFGLGLHWLCLWFMVVVLVCYVGDLGGLGWWFAMLGFTLLLWLLRFGVMVNSVGYVLFVVLRLLLAGLAVYYSVDYRF